MEYITLNNGVRMPHMGFGTIGQSGEQITDNVAFALTHGYELIDTANRYGNEVEVGEGLRRSGVKRESYLLETKLGPTLYENDRAIDDTLKRLGLDYIDIMLLHHPVNNYRYAYGMLVKAYKAGKIRAIGLSNFPDEKIQEILDNFDTPPALMQVEGHPYFPAEEAKPFCDGHQIALQTWFPLGHGNSALMGEPVIAALAEKYGKDPAQIILRWHVQFGFCPVPGSRSHGHIESNARIFDFALTGEDMAALASLNKHEPFFRPNEAAQRMVATTKCNFEE